MQSVHMGFYLSCLVPDFYKLHACCYWSVVSNTQYIWKALGEGGGQSGVILVSVTLIYMYRFISQYKVVCFGGKFGIRLFVRWIVDSFRLLGILFCERERRK